MKKIMLHTFIKRLVEKGTDDRYTLLPLNKPMDESLTIQKSMQEIINVRNNTCEHSYEITIDEFIKNNKVCKSCLLVHNRHISSDNEAVYYSLHNTQTI